MSDDNPLLGGNSTPIPEHVQRMAAETQQVVQRLQNLDGFTHTKTFQELSILERQLMHEQKDQMVDYAKTLSLRYCMALLAHG